MGPLEGIRVLEISSLAPTAMTGMMLADMGADILRVDRPSAQRAPVTREPHLDTLARGDRPSIVVDMKQPGAAELILAIATEMDVLVEGFRPGVCERLGIGPSDVLSVNPELIYTRLTGWGQTGPYSSRPGHDINYVGLSGALYAIGRKDIPPPPPLNLLADFAGGSFLAVIGILASLFERGRSGLGQVVDVAMLEGTALLTAALQSMRVSEDRWWDERGANLLDGGAPHYNTYRTADDKFVAVGAIEVKFQKALLTLLGLDDAILEQLQDRRAWPKLLHAFGEIFRSRTQEEWLAEPEAWAACVSPVLAPSDVLEDAHIRHRNVFVKIGEVVQPAPAPRLSRTPLVDPRPPMTSNPQEILASAGYGPEQVKELKKRGVLG